MNMKKVITAAVMAVEIKGVIDENRINSCRGKVVIWEAVATANPVSLVSPVDSW